MFRGRFEHSIDDKGRIAIPSRFRSDLAVDGAEATVVITNFEKCLAAYPLHEWEALEKRVAALPQFDPKVIQFQRYFISGATECQLDKAGRILIPANLRQFAQIERDCVISGQLTKFEIWSADRWHKEFHCLSEQFASITETMSSFGINL